jgi:hypothetical protein
MDETDPWWFVPLLYIGLGLTIAGLAVAGLQLIVAFASAFTTAVMVPLCPRTCCESNACQPNP